VAFHRRLRPPHCRLRIARTAPADFVLDALEQALHARRPAKRGLVHRSDRGGQCLALRFAERLLEASIEPSVGRSSRLARKRLPLAEVPWRAMACCAASGTPEGPDWPRPL
jgi:transposase InsO family protein